MIYWVHNKNKIHKIHKNLLIMVQIFQKSQALSVGNICIYEEMQLMFTNCDVEKFALSIAQKYSSWFST